MLKGEIKSYDETPIVQHYTPPATNSTWKKDSDFTPEVAKLCQNAMVTATEQGFIYGVHVREISTGLVAKIMSVISSPGIAWDEERKVAKVIRATNEYGNTPYSYIYSIDELIIITEEEFNNGKQFNYTNYEDC